MVKIIGIDPGLSATGVGIVRGTRRRVTDFSFGNIRTTTQSPLPERLYHIFSKLSQIIESSRPDLMVVEDVFSLEKYPKSGITLGKVTGAVLLAGCQMKLPVLEIPVREAKKVLTGNGRASKAQLENAVRHFLRTDQPIKPNHASDAIALALIGLFRGGPGVVL